MQVKLIYWTNSLIKLNNISFRSLRAFIILAEQRQFNLAAAHCHMSQSALSQMVSRLEQQFGARLFERSTRHVALTPEGELLLSAARRMLQDMQSVQENILDHVQGRRGKVSLAALPSLSDDWLPGAIAAFRTSHPGVRVKLFDVMTDAGVELLRRCQVDFMLTPLVTDSEEFEVRTLSSERFFLVCPPDHRFAGLTSVTPAQLAHCDYIHSNRSGSVWSFMEPLLRDVPLCDTGLEVFQFGTLAGLIEKGLGVTIVPEFSLHQFQRRGLAAVPFAPNTVRRPLRMAKRRGQALSMAAQALLTTVEGLIPRQPH